MKKIAVIVTAFVALIGFNACEEENQIEFVANMVSGPVIVSPTTSLALNEDQDAIQAYTVVWDHGDYDVSTPITYNVEVALSGTGFQNPINAAQTSARFYTWTVEQLNKNALEAGLIGGEEGLLDIRVISSIGTQGSEKEISDPLTISVTPYEKIIIPEPEFAYLFLVGNGTDSNKDGEANNSDWNNNATNSYLFRDPANEKRFTYTGNFEANAFKFLVNKGQWAPQFGGEAGTLILRPTEEEPDPSSITIAEAGYYTVNVDIEALSYTVEAYDASAADVYDGLELMGDAFNSEDADGDQTADGWQTGLQLERSDFDPHVWYKNDVVLGEGQAKFRANMNWDFSWGGDSFPSAIESSGNNVPTVPGTYDIWFNDLTKSYIFVVK